MQMASILGLHGWNPNHTPHAPFSGLVPDQHSEQFLPVQPIGLHPALAPVHFDACRIHDEALNALGLQPPMEPEALPARLVAGHDPHLSLQPEPPLRILDLSENCAPVSRSYLPLPGFTTHTSSHGESPVEIVQFEGYVQDESLGSTLFPAGRTCPHRTPPFLMAMSGWSLTGATRCRLTASGPHSISEPGNLLPIQISTPR